MPARPDRTIMLGIVGDSASGKSTLARGVAAVLGQERVNTLDTDHYHLLDRAARRECGITALDPRASHVDILQQHLQLLRAGQPILRPTYDHRTGTHAAAVYVTPRPFVIVEGLLPFATPELRSCIDVGVFLEPEEELRRRWKRERDTTRRGYTLDEVNTSIWRRAADVERFIRPQRAQADMVVSFSQPPEGARFASDDERDSHLDSRHVLRKTLPFPDLAPLLLKAHSNEVSLELTRDDGEAVDVVDIRGDISDERAIELEETLWSLVPEASHMQGNIGRLRDDQRSHALALSQLFLAFNMVKAALAQASDQREFDDRMGTGPAAASERPSQFEPRRRLSA